MSIARQLLNEFRPFIRMLDEPLTRSSVPFIRSHFDDPFWTLSRDILRGPAVDVTEEGDNYVENLEVRVREGGRSLTVEGKLAAATEGSGNNATASEGVAVETTNELKPTRISTERSVIGNFSRTVFLPRPVDAKNIAATFQDGILRIKVKQAEEESSVVVPVH
ncbi:HSP20-like chaperone [Mycena rebaudengoi]|nr:HSP20-like chaperone [Mycena rebaudengoi]